MRGRITWKLVAGLAAAAMSVGGATAAAMSGAGTVKAAANAKFGSLLVTASGMTLYHYTAEKNGKIACTTGCVNFWPPLLVTTKPSAGVGVTAGKLSTVKRPDGKIQVTYAGFPLYRYSGDKKAGDVNGQGVLHAWFAVTSAGALASAKQPVANPAPPPTTTNGGGYSYP